MNSHNSNAVVMAMWDRINTSPWITLKRVNRMDGYALNYEMTHSKTLARQTFRLEMHSIYMLTDPWTQEYIVAKLIPVLTALTHNTVEAGTGSLDVYREDYPA